jgi:hypothetical protein
MLHQPVDARVAIGGELLDRILHEGAQVGVLPGRGAGAALPAAGLEREIVVERARNLVRRLR